MDKRPYPGFVRAYGHNGCFLSLKEIVHFYSTRNTLPRCKPHDPGGDKTCGPQPEATPNLNTTMVGNLRLTDIDEYATVVFFETLTGGYFSRGTHSGAARTLLGAAAQCGSR